MERIEYTSSHDLFDLEVESFGDLKQKVIRQIATSSTTIQDSPAQI